MELEAQVERGSFSREAVSSCPELSAVYDRLLSNASWECLRDGRHVIYTPTNMQAERLQRFHASLESVLHGPISSIQVKRPTDSALAAATPGVASQGRPQMHLVRSAAPAGSSPPTTTGPDQLAMSFASPRPQAVEADPLKAELDRRLAPPVFVAAPCYEQPVELVRLWAESVNTGRRGGSLWVHGESGSGKTWLLRQLSEWISLGKRLTFVSAQDFFREWVTAIRNKDTFAFNRKYRYETDVFVLENLDELQGKTKTIEEILFTVNALLDRGASIAVSSALEPQALRELLGPALFSRLFSGMVAFMGAPDRAFREQLWRHLLEQHGLRTNSLDLVLQERLLGVEVSTARNAQALFINAIGRISCRKELTPEDLAEIQNRHGIRSFVTRDTSAQCRSPRELAEAICRLTGVSLPAIQGRAKRHDLSMSRRFVCLALSRYAGLTNASISALIEKDASTVSHAIKTALEEIRSQAHVGQQWHWVCEQLGLPPHGFQ